ncbi:hypothetical protein TNCT_121761 [Trichonephila clavata]|uniref:Uncharacterized protein n=1 Tax=Trichonephila clavata TaxID=2740835 RepID=A0A8X6GGD8_TRICU|nr:hypothetical protein TNCT_121761 [Trichonephila clavata]
MGRAPVNQTPPNTEPSSNRRVSLLPSPSPNRVIVQQEGFPPSDLSTTPTPFLFLPRSHRPIEGSLPSPPPTLNLLDAREDYPPPTPYHATEG